MAALLPNERDRVALRDASSSSGIVWVESWPELQRVVREQPVDLAVTDLHAEARRDGALRVYRFARRFPRTPLLVWGEPDGRELFRLGKAGASDVILAQDAGDSLLLAEILDAAAPTTLAQLLLQRVGPRLDSYASGLLAYTADNIPARIQVPALAAHLGISVSTLERRCERWQLPTPGRLLLWLRVLYGVRWLLEPGRSVESVAVQLGYSSGAAYRRAIKATIGGRPTPLRSHDGFDRALDMFVAECGPPERGA